MSLTRDQRAELMRKLQLTDDRELDCDQFLHHLAEYVEKQPLSEELQRLMDIHLQLCPECAEELDLLRRALK